MLKTFAVITALLLSAAAGHADEPIEGSWKTESGATAEIGNLLLDDIVPGLAGAIETEFSTRR